jgi:hypothetical protein
MTIAVVSPEEDSQYRSSRGSSDLIAGQRILNGEAMIVIECGEFS